MTTAYECAICLETCVEPATALCGQHNFCRDHLIAYIQGNQPTPTCPTCRRPIQTRAEQVTVNVGIRDAIAAQMTESAARSNVPRIPFEQIEFETNKRGQWQELGRGAAGTVYSASFLGEPVAVKYITLPRPPNAAAAVQKIRDRIRLEVGLHYNLRHDGVVALHGESEDAGDDGTPEGVAIVMQRMTKTLQQWAAEQAPSVRDRLLRLREVLKALRFLHARGIVHGDIKPGNIMVDESGAARLCDFGSARLRQDGDASGAAALSRSMGLATPLYLDPAVFAKERNKRKASDVYSFCIMAWELLAGQVPFSGAESESIESLLAHVRVEANRPDLALLPAVEPESGRSLEPLKLALTRGWAGRQEDRAPAGDILSAIEGALHKDAPLAPLPPPPPAPTAPEGTGKLIFDAAANENYAELQALLVRWRGHSDVLNWTNADGKTPLVVAVETVNGPENDVLFRFLDLLIATPGVDINKVDAKGQSALGLALELGLSRAAAMLRKAGAEVSELEAGKCIYNASRHNDTEELARLLLKWGGNAAALNWVCGPDDSYDDSGCTAILTAGANAARMLLHTGLINVNYTSRVGCYKGKSALIIAMERGMNEKAAYLRAEGGLEIGRMTRRSAEGWWGEDESGMHIHVKTLTGTSFNIQIQPSDTIEQLKAIVELAEGTPPYHQKLIFSSKQLEAGRTISEYDIQEGSSIHLIHSWGGKTTCISSHADSETRHEGNTQKPGLVYPSPLQLHPHPPPPLPLPRPLPPPEPEDSELQKVWAHVWLNGAYKRHAATALRSRSHANCESSRPTEQATLSPAQVKWFSPSLDELKSERAGEVSMKICQLKWVWSTPTPTTEEEIVGDFQLFILNKSGPEFEVIRLIKKSRMKKAARGGLRGSEVPLVDDVDEAAAV